MGWQPSTALTRCCCCSLRRRGQLLSLGRTRMLGLGGCSQPGRPFMGLVRRCALMEEQQENRGYAVCGFVILPCLSWPFSPGLGKSDSFCLV